MKKLTMLLMAMALVIGLSGIAMANGDGLGISGSAHDFSDGLEGGATGTPAIDESWNNRGEICRVCHVPHDHSKAAQHYTNGLLWNHDVSVVSYTMYDNAWSETITGTQSAQPDGTSKLCLGCHDGTVGIDQFDGRTGAGTVNITAYDAGYKVPGFSGDLRGTHPLSIQFPAGQTGDGKNFADPTVATWADGSTVASTLNNNKVQCSTCHDVHNQESVAATHLLRTAQKNMGAGEAASGLCLTCHIK